MKFLAYDDNLINFDTFKEIKKEHYNGIPYIVFKSEKNYYFPYKNEQEQQDAFNLIQGFILDDQLMILDKEDLK